MDKYWADVASYIESANKKGAKILAPAQFSEVLPLVGDYDSRNEITGLDVLVLHKTDYRRLPADLVRNALNDLIVSFANEVFVVLVRGPPPIEVNPSHLGVLAEIREWLSNDGYSDGKYEALTMHDGLRMAATYVGRGRVLLQNAFGQLMLVTGEDTSITPHLIRDGWFDLGLTRFLTRTLRPHQIFVDVGANFGIYTLIAAAIVGPLGRVISVEANPEIAEILHENAVMNGFGGSVTVLRNAAGEAEGTLPIFTFSIRQGGSTMVSAVAEMAKTDYGERIVRTDVSCRTLDEMLVGSGVDAIDLLKIDVEGYESAVLRGARACMVKYRPKLLMEWHPAFMPADSGDGIHAFLVDELGYRLRRIEADGATRPVDLTELMTLEHSDVLAVPGRV